MNQRKIIHVDMDCFYAAVEVKHQPHLKGKPLAIGGPPNSRSVLCTASYEARKFGVRAAMPSSQAVRLCPQLVLIPPHFELYKAESQALRKIFARYTSRVEPLSLDEAYLDVSTCQDFNGSATRIAQEIRAAIEQELKLTASAGIAPNKFLAKIASDWKKPNGQFVIRPEEIAEFMRELKIEKLYGVGKVTAKKMHSLGLMTCGDIQRQSLFQLAKWFGSRAFELSQLARGIDYREVECHSERKSLTVEHTFHKDLMTYDECLKSVPQLYEDWARRIDNSELGHKIKGHIVKLKFSDFRSTTHEVASTARPTQKNFEILLEDTWKKNSAPVRLIGLGTRLMTESKGTSKSQLSFAI